MSYNKFAMHGDARGGRPMMPGNPNIGWQSRTSMPSSLPSHPFIPNELPSAHFRSAAEASLDSSSKFRQLPCKTLIAVGTCPYGERCVFLHDPRLICHTAHSISRLKNKEDNVVDSFFWPLASSDAPVHGNKKSDHNFRPYTIAPPNNDQFKLHDQALYSIWSHYVEFCRITAKEQKSFGNGPKMSPQDTPLNVFTQTKRLPVFQLLSSSNGHPITREQYYLAANQDEANVRSSPVEMAPRVSAIVQSIPVKVVGRAVSPTGVNQRYVFSPDERFPDMVHALSKQNSREKMMMREMRHRSHSGEVSSGFPSYMSECDDSVGDAVDHEEWNTQHAIITTFDNEQSWM